MSAAVVGMGATRFVRRSGASEAALAAQAITAALRDARLSAADVDGVVRFDRDALWEYDLPGTGRMSGLPFYNALPFGPGSAPALLRMAAMAVHEGLATTVLCYHARDAARRGMSVPELEVVLLAKRARLTERDVTKATIAHRRAAARNPKALVRRPLTASARRAHPYVAEPLRAVDFAIPSAGACAFVVTDAERARRRPVRIVASMQVGLPAAVRQASEWLAAKPLDRVARAARAMYRTARIRASDVDVACLHADASALVPLAVRAYGVARARVNPHGGQLCEAALDGVNDVAEAVRQLRGEAASQVRGARLALVAGSFLEPTSAVLLAS